MADCAAPRSPTWPATSEALAPGRPRHLDNSALRDRKLGLRQQLAPNIFLDFDLQFDGQEADGVTVQVHYVLAIVTGIVVHPSFWAARRRRSPASSL
jgi:hypothetical protein